MNATAPWLLSLGLSATLLAVTAPRAAQSRGECRRAEGELSRTVSLAQDLRALGSTHPPQPAAASNLQPRIASVLAACALPASALQSLAPEPESAQRSADGGSLRRRRATLVLQGLTLRGLGSFLQGWRSVEPGWVISSIDLTQTGTAEPGADLPLRAALVLEHTRVDAAPTAAAPLDALTPGSRP